MRSYFWAVRVIWQSGLCSSAGQRTKVRSNTSTRTTNSLVRPPKAAALGSLIEHESCISLTHSRCWSPTSRLKSSREEGAGLGQLTRAWRTNGTLRFDALQEIRSLHKKELGELSWDNIYTRPDLQIRAVVLKSRDNYNYYRPYSHNDLEALAFADAAYNGGIGGLDSERRACKLAPGCDHTKWFGNVELYCLKSKAALYGNRSACDINRHHVKDVLLTRISKYTLFFE